MINKATLDDLFHHMEWADATVWTSVLASQNAKTDGKLRDYLIHHHAVQRAFLCVWRQEPRETPPSSFTDLESLLQWGRPFYREAFAYLDTVDEEKIPEPMPLPWARMVEKRLGRSPETTTVGETALQIALHSTYHRGQINARLREIGGEPPLVDYIAWVWLGRPSPNWPAV